MFLFNRLAMAFNSTTDSASAPVESKPEVEESDSLTEAERTEFKVYVRSFQRPPLEWTCKFWIKGNFGKKVTLPVIKALIEEAMTEIFGKRYEVHTAYPSPPPNCTALLLM